jgi:hypothetical protein
MDEPRYDPQRDRRFSGSFQLKHCPRPGLRVHAGLTPASPSQRERHRVFE